MLYCEDCGRKYTTPKNYCRGCGNQLAQVTATTTASLHTGGLSESIAVGMERAHSRIRRRQRKAQAANESLNLYIGFVAVVGMLQGLAYMGGKPVTSLLNGNLGAMLFAGILVGALFKVVADLRYGYSFARSFMEVIVVGVLAYGLTFGVFWYLTENFIHSGKPLLDFGKMAPTAVHTAIPKRCYHTETGSLPANLCREASRLHNLLCARLQARSSAYRRYAGCKQQAATCAIVARLRRAYASVLDTIRMPVGILCGLRSRQSAGALVAASGPLGTYACAPLAVRLAM